MYLVLLFFVGNFASFKSGFLTAGKILMIRKITFKLNVSSSSSPPPPPTKENLVFLTVVGWFRQIMGDWQIDVGSKVNKIWSNQYLLEIETYSMF